MMLISLVAALPLLGGPEIKWTAPTTYIAGAPYSVHVEITAPREGTVVSSWLLDEGAFTIDGKPLGKREDAGTLTLPGGFTLQGDIDLSGQVPSGPGEFKLGYAADLVDTPTITVQVREGVPAGTDFMKVPLEELGKYRVLLQTNQGDIEVELWPDVAPNHARNFLDLAQTRFYDGTIFHRVSPTFMIQGGDPTGTGGGDGPRKLKAEFNAKKHVPGVLSAARSQDPDSASCQFFIMTAASPGLDGQYSAFGQTVQGMDTVQRIARSPGRQAPDGTVRPNEPQKILHAYVVKPLSK